MELPGTRDKIAGTNSIVGLELVYSELEAVAVPACSRVDGI